MTGWQICEIEQGMNRKKRRRGNSRERSKANHESIKVEKKLYNPCAPAKTAGREREEKV